MILQELGGSVDIVKIGASLRGERVWDWCDFDNTHSGESQAVGHGEILIKTLYQIMWQADERRSNLLSLE